MNDALNDMEKEETDILILTRTEAKLIKDVLDFSESLFWEGQSENVYIAVPKNNKNHLNNIQKCLENEF